MDHAVSNNLENEIRSLIAEILEIDEAKITPEARFAEDLGMDSMMALEILASVEKKFKIKIAEEYLTKAISLNSMVDIAKKLLNKT